MPEGDTIFRTARTLQRALAGRTVTRFESVYPALARVDHDRPLAGRTVESVTSRGKHLLIAFSGDLWLHTHMRMHGSWHVYRPGERWQRPRHEMRILLETAEYVAVGFTVPVAEFLTSTTLARHEILSTLGPDLAASEFDRDEVIRRIHGRGAEPIQELLLNQRVVAGIGNVLKSEILFVAGIDPFASSDQLLDGTLERLLAVARRLMAMNTAGRDAALSPVLGRRTTGRLDPRIRLWVYGRGGKPCLTCGTAIESRGAGIDARLTYWCPRCQATGR
jgi:endonuclease-8